MCCTKRCAHIHMMQLIGEYRGRAQCAITLNGYTCCKVCAHMRKKRCIFDAIIMAFSNCGVWFMHEVYCFLTMHFYIIWLSFELKLYEKKAANPIALGFFPTDIDVDKKCYGRHRINGMKQLLNSMHKCRIRLSFCFQIVACKRTEKKFTKAEKSDVKKKQAAIKSNYSSLLFSSTNYYTISKSKKEW